MDCWLTIEVQDGGVPASLWRDGRGEALVEAAVTNGATRSEAPRVPPRFRQRSHNSGTPPTLLCNAEETNCSRVNQIRRFCRSSAG